VFEIRQLFYKYLLYYI